MSDQIARRGRHVTNAATPETATGGHRSDRRNYTRIAWRNKAHLVCATVDSPLVIAAADAIVGLRHERGSGVWEVDTPAGTLKCSTRGLIQFKRFRNRCAYHLNLALSPRPTQDDWLRILHDAMTKLRKDSGRTEGPR